MTVGFYIPGEESGLDSTLYWAKENGLKFVEIKFPEDLLKTKVDSMIIDPTLGMDFERVREYIKKNPETHFLINCTIKEFYKEFKRGKNLEFLSLLNAPSKVREILENDSNN